MSSGAATPRVGPAVPGRASGLKYFLGLKYFPRPQVSPNTSNGPELAAGLAVNVLITVINILL